MIRRILVLIGILAVVAPELALSQAPQEVKVGEAIPMRIRNREPIMTRDYSVFQFDQTCELRFGGTMWGLGVLKDRTLIVYKDSGSQFSFECPTKAIGFVPTSYFAASQALHDKERARRQEERATAEEEAKIIELILKKK